MEGHNKWGKAIVMVIIGLILIYLNSSYPQYIWAFIGVLLILKAIMIAVMPCDKKKRR